MGVVVVARIYTRDGINETVVVVVVIFIVNVVVLIVVSLESHQLEHKLDAYRRV